MCSSDSLHKHLCMQEKQITSICCKQDLMIELTDQLLLLLTVMLIDIRIGHDVVNIIVCGLSTL